MFELRADEQIWSTKTFQLLYIIRPCDNTSGDIYSLAWDDRAGGTLYFGAQNTSIEWVNFGKPLPGRSSNGGVPSLVAVSQTLSIQQSNGTSTPGQRSGRYKPHSFFDTPPADMRSGTSTPRTPVAQPVCSSRSTYLSVEREVEAEPEAVEFEVDCDSIVFYAHYGYVYALETIKRPDGARWLASGSGDSDIKIWECTPGGGLNLVREFNSLAGAVLSLAYRDSLLYAGLQDGEIDVWDLETGARIRTIEAHESDVMAMAVLGSDVYTGAADGRVLRINGAFDCTAAFNAHADSVLACTVVRTAGGPGYELVTAGNDSFVKIWTSLGTSLKSIHDTDVEVDLESNADVMLYALSKLVAIPTVSDEKHRESCRQGAHLLHKILGQLGARSEMLSGDPGKNPLVLATFQGRDTGKSRKRVLFYGHYDVQPAGEKDWESDPWELNGRNGYLYGRGVSDNKGPVLAVACAAAALQQSRQLDVDLVMIVEGEEEAGSRGFANSVRKHKDSIGHIDVVFLANSTWIDEEDPCVVYGMRGVVYAQLMVQSGGEDAHNGVEGGLVKEPMFDLVQLLSSLADTNGVNVPGFCERLSSMVCTAKLTCRRQGAPEDRDRGGATEERRARVWPRRGRAQARVVPAHLLNREHHNDLRAQQDGHLEMRAGGHCDAHRTGPEHRRHCRVPHQLLPCQVCRVENAERTRGQRHPRGGMVARKLGQPLLPCPRGLGQGRVGCGAAQDPRRWHRADHELARARVCGALRAPPSWAVVGRGTSRQRAYSFTQPAERQARRRALPDASGRIVGRDRAGVTVVHRVVTVACITV